MEPRKDRFLRTIRGISFPQITDEIIVGNYIHMLKNPGRSDQQIFLLRIAGNVWVVPLVLEEEETIFFDKGIPEQEVP